MEAVKIAKNAELVVELDTPITKEKGYLYYIKGRVAGDGKIIGIFRSPMKYKLKE